MRMAIGGFLSAILRGTCLFGMRQASPQAQPIIGGAVPSQPIYPLLTRLCPEPIEVPFSKWEGFSVWARSSRPCLDGSAGRPTGDLLTPRPVTAYQRGSTFLGGMSR